MRFFWRWIPFILVFCGLTVLAEVDFLRDGFIARYGNAEWDNLHLYGSFVLVIAACQALPRRLPVWRRLLVALTLVLAAGVLREVRQSYEVGPSGFSRHDIKNDILGATAGSVLCMVWNGMRRSGQNSAR